MYWIIPEYLGDKRRAPMAVSYTFPDFLSKITHTPTVDYYSAVKINEVLPFVTTWVDLKDIILSKI